MAFILEGTSDTYTNIISVAWMHNAMSNLHRVHEGPGQGAGPTLPRVVERGAAARADRAHRRDHRVQDPGQGLGTQTRQAGLSEYWGLVK